MLDVEQWAEIRRMRFVEGLAIREIARRTGRDRKTVQRAVRASEPPRYRRPAAGSKLDAVKEEMHRLLRADPRLPGARIFSLISELGCEASKTLVDNYLREVRPLYLPRRTYQRTIYRPGEIVQFDLFEPRLPVPVGYGQHRRRAWVLVAALCFSRVMAGALVFSKEAHDVLWALGRCLGRLGGLPGVLVTDREGGCTRARAGRRMSTPPSAGSWRSAGISAIRVTRRPRGLSRTANGSFARALSRGGRSPTICISRTSWTVGSTLALTALPTARFAVGRSIGSGRSSSGCGRCPGGCPISTGVGCCASRPIRICGLTPTTTRSPPALPDAESRCASHSRR